MTLTDATTTGQPNEQDELHALRQMLVGYQNTQLLVAAARLRLIDLLVDRGRPVPAGELAEELAVPPEPLGYLLELLCGHGILDRGTAGYGPTLRGLMLDSRRTDGLYPTVTATGAERYASWGRLDHVVRTGRPAFPDLHGQNLHDYYAAHPQAARTFNAAMAALSEQTARELARAYDFNRHHTVVDVGGGIGVFLTAVLATHAGPCGVLVDLPHVIDQASLAVTGPQAGRIQLHPGDARTGLPVGADCYVFKMVLCDFTDTDAAAMLRACRHAVADTGRLIIIDKIRRPADSSDPTGVRTLMSALNLAVMTGSRERSTDQYAALLQAAGFTLADVARTTALQGELFLLRAEPREVA